MYMLVMLEYLSLFVYSRLLFLKLLELQFRNFTMYNPFKCSIFYYIHLSAVCVEGNFILAIFENIQFGVNGMVEIFGNYFFTQFTGNSLLQVFPTDFLNSLEDKSFLSTAECVVNFQSQGWNFFGCYFKLYRGLTIKFCSFDFTASNQSCTRFSKCFRLFTLIIILLVFMFIAKSIYVDA